MSYKLGITKSIATSPVAVGWPSVRIEEMYSVGIKDPALLCFYLHILKNSPSTIHE